VWGTAPSVVYEQADVPSLSGGTEVSADEPEVAAGDDSSYADVVFHEVVAYGSQDQSRVMMSRLRGSQYDSITQPDGVPTGTAEQADDPEVVIGEFGRGLITMAPTDSDQLFVTRLNTDGARNGTLRLDSLTNTSGPDAVPAMAGVNTDLVAWQQDPDFGASSEIRVRYSTDSVTFGPELVVSSPALGPTDAADGLFASGDRPGNAAVAWVQGSEDSTRIVADQLYQPPGSFALKATSRYLRTVHPVLSWSQPGDHWGPIDYTLRIDGVPVAQTDATSMAVPGALGQGPHRWLVIAANPSGLAVSTKLGRFWVDSVPPEVRLSLTGVRRAGTVLHLYVRYTDSPPPVPARDASGVASVVVRWGDGSSFRIHHRTFHAYLRPGRYRLTVVVEDRAGNKTTIVTTVKIAPETRKKKPTRRAKHHSGRQR